MYAASARSDGGAAELVHVAPRHPPGGQPARDDAGERTTSRASEREADADGHVAALDAASSAGASGTGAAGASTSSASVATCGPRPTRRRARRRRARRTTGGGGDELVGRTARSLRSSCAPPRRFERSAATADERVEVAGRSPRGTRSSAATSTTVRDPRAGPHPGPARADEQRQHEPERRRRRSPTSGDQPNGDELICSRANCRSSTNSIEPPPGRSATWPGCRLTRNGLPSVLAAASACALSSM